MPILLCAIALSRPKSTNERDATRCPLSYTFRNSRRAASLFVDGKCRGGRGSDCEAFAPLPASPGKDERAAALPHSDEEPMGFFPPPVVRLKRALHGPVLSFVDRES